MAINGINNTGNPFTYGSAANYGKTKAAENAAAQKAADEKSKTEKGEAAKTQEKSAYSVDLEELYKAQNAYTQGLKNMVSQVLSQAAAQKTASGDFSQWSLAGDLKFAVKYSRLLVKTDDGYALDPSITGAERDNLVNKAKEDVSENGYFGVKQTSERILKFAESLSGGDPKKLEELRLAVEKAFKQVEKMFGGELPEISRKTYDAIMAGFDEMTKTEE